MKLHALLLILIAATLLAACSAPAPKATPTPMPTGMVGVGEYRLFYQCRGQGSPTVILEAGMGSESSYWASVIPRVEENTRICAYDRANLGRSDEAQTPRTFQDAARDLQALLGNARIDGPYILVGHSLGGELVRVFADQYPEEVAGMVLVDAAHPSLGSRLLAGLPPESADEPESVMFWRRFLTWASDSNGSPNPGDPEAKAYLVDRTTGGKLTVPRSPKVGPMRQSAENLAAGKVYFAMFSNKGKAVKPGSKVTVLIGDFKAENLAVQ